MTPKDLGILAGMLHKQSMPTTRGRAGRTCKGSSMQKHLSAAGSTQSRTGVFSFPKGRRV